MTTQTVEAPTNPEITVISRITSIPLVASSLSTIHTTLTNNAYTRQLYTTVQGLSNSVLSYTEPLQKRFAPLLVRADSYANKGFDALESRYPYPFRTPSEDIVKDLKGRSDHAYDIANQTIDEKVKTPAYSVAQGIDQRFALIVDYFEAAVNKLHPNGSTEQTAAPAAEAKYQYQRAYALSRDLSDHLRTYSTEQINQLKTQNILVQRATETSQTLGVLASTSYGTAQMKVQALSDTMLAELQRIQVCLTFPSVNSHVPVHFSRHQQRLFPQLCKHHSTIYPHTSLLPSPTFLRFSTRKILFRRRCTKCATWSRNVCTPYLRQQRLECRKYLVY
ncbi:hypothetical protein AcV5_002341 [Taiwanofungus camphoratus]|nr:hypothetical protein AcV5_002341 [Antrodia cinnamomea]KAI0941878.1 hypothetical protein AcV7_002446 [Antrodia cinnamomea]